MQFNKSYFKLHFLVVLWGFTAILGLMIKLSFIEVVFYRTLFAFLALAIILQITRIGFFIRPREVIKLLLTGVVISFHWLLFFGAARYSNASVSLIGLSTTALWTSLIEPIVHKRKISVIEIIFGLAVIAGLYIIYNDDFTYGLGLLMSLGSALFAAIFTVMNYGFIRKYDAISITFYEMVGAWLTTIPFLWLMRTEGASLLSLPTWSDTGYLLILALVCTVYANSVATKLLKEFTAFSSNLIINMEPVYGILLALLIFGDSERMNTSFYLGALSIIAAVFIYPIFLRKFQRKIR
ncbi:MAG: EamA family transporter [Bacteroidetes bacterium]|nr:MAG: EamA family transporter [Bacteroidota bacterium]